MYQREGRAGAGDRIPGLSRRRFIRAAGSAGLLGGLGALVTACSTSATSTSPTTTIRPSHHRGSSGSSFPGASTTGPAAGGYSSLTPVSIAATTDIRDTGNPVWVQTQPNGGLLIEGQSFTWTGSSDPQGFMISVGTTRKVTFRGCRFAMDGLAAGVMVEFHAAGEWHVEYCEFASNGTGHYHCAISSATGPGTINHCNIYEWAQAIHLQPGSAGSALTDNYVHDPGFLTGDHTDGLYLWDGVSNITVQHNTVLNHLPQTDCLYRGPIGGGHGTYWRDNLFAGGGYTLYGAGKSPAGITGFVIENNWFSTRYYPHCGYDGPAAYMPEWGADGNVWSNNRWYDGPNTGKLVRIPDA
jgi:hypothetical protein